MPKAIIWDLDGTLLDTLEDLAASTNAALTAHGYPPRSLSEVRAFVGNGVRNLIARALPRENCPDYEAVFADFRTHYAAHCNDRTRPYPGILDALRELKAAGIPMAVVSNKLDPAVKALCRLHFGDLLDCAIGECDGLARKPAPDMVFRALDLLGCTEGIYVGDSEVDIATAENAGLPAVIVGWGFRPAETLLAAGAKRVVGDVPTLTERLKEAAV